MSLLSDATVIEVARIPPLRVAANLNASYVIWASSR
jgi:hypothetical protein